MEFVERGMQFRVSQMRGITLGTPLGMHHSLQVPASRFHSMEMKHKCILAKKILIIFESLSFLC